MENNLCIKCDDLGSMRTITMDDGEMSSTIGANLCDECYNSLFDCIVEMIYGEEED